MPRQTKEDSPALKLPDDSRTLDLHIGSVNRGDANAIHGIAGKTATGWRGQGSCYRVSVQAQLDVIRSEGDTWVRPGHGQRDSAGDVTHEFAVFVDGECGGDGTADLSGLSTCAQTNSANTEKTESVIRLDRIRLIGPPYAVLEVAI
jgi:hypothetical protein